MLGIAFFQNRVGIKLADQHCKLLIKFIHKASGHKLPVLGVYNAKSVAVMHNNKSSLDRKQIDFVVTDIPQLNVLSREVITTLNIALDDMIDGKQCGLSLCKSVYQCAESLQSACQQMCNKFPVFNDELGCQKDFELDIKFKPDITPVFCKSQTGPLPYRMTWHKLMNGVLQKGCGSLYNSMILAHQYYQ